MNKQKKDISKIEELDIEQKKIASLARDLTLPRKFEEQEKILLLKNKAINFLKETLDGQFNDNEVLSDDFNQDLILIGQLLEKEELLNNLPNHEADYDDVVDLIEDQTLKISKKLGLEENPQNEVELSDDLIKEQITTQAKNGGLVKEKIIDGTIENQNGQIASSLVVDATKDVAQKTIENLNNKINPKPTPLTKFKKKSKKEEQKDIQIANKLESFTLQQEKGIILDTETFSSHISNIPPNIVKVNIKNMREKSLGLSNDRPNVVVEQSGLVTERRRVI